MDFNPWVNQDMAQVELNGGKVSIILPYFYEKLLERLRELWEENRFHFIALAKAFLPEAAVQTFDFNGESDPTHGPLILRAWLPPEQQPYELNLLATSIQDCGYTPLAG